MSDNSVNNKRKSFFEDFLKIRIKGKPGKESEIGIASPSNTLVHTLDALSESGNFVNTSEFQSFRTLGSDRNEQYRMYDEMANDSIIASALELYADDSTQYNAKGQVIWAESEDTNIAQFANRLIDVLQINENAWSHIYNLVKYGDVYIQLFKDDEINDDPLIKTINKTNVDTVKNRKGAILEEYIEQVPNPAEMFDLSARGKTVGFVGVELYDNTDQTTVFQQYQYSINDNNIKVYEPNKFIHFMLSATTDRFPEKMTLDFGVGNDGKTTIKSTYNVKRGKSILQDIYKIYREIQLMEDSLLLNRVTRSSIIRLLQIEVGDMPQQNVKLLLERFKRMIEQRNYLDKDQGKFTSAATPGPIDNVLYIPTHDGKGQVSMSNLGGDVDVKSITDVDYFKNKLYGGLKIPKQFLGDTDDAAGFSGGTSLTKLDSRYARTVKRIQNAYIAGITTLINLYALNRGFTDYINNFTIRMVTPSTTEDAERDESLSTKIDIADRFLGLIPDDMVEPQTKKDMLVYFMANYLSEPELAQMLEEDQTLEKMKQEELDQMDMETNGAGGPGPGGNSVDIDFGEPSGGEEFGGPEEFGEESTDMGEEPGSDEGWDFGEIDLH